MIFALIQIGCVLAVSFALIAIFYSIIVVADARASRENNSYYNEYRGPYAYVYEWAYRFPSSKKERAERNSERFNRVAK